MWPILLLAVGGYFYLNKGNKEKEEEARKQALAAKYQNKLSTVATKDSVQLNVNPNLATMLQSKIAEKQTQVVQNKTNQNFVTTNRALPVKRFKTSPPRFKTREDQLAWEAKNLIT